MNGDQLIDILIEEENPIQDECFFRSLCAD